MAITIKAKNGNEWLSVSSLPSVSEKDDGKSLIVKNGEWVVTKTANSGSQSVIKQLQSDWNEKDPSKSSYIKNRTHYKDPAAVLREEVLLDQTFSFEFMPELNAYVAEGSCNAFMIEDNTEVTLQIDNNLPTTHKILSIAGIMSVIGNPIGLMGIMSSGIESEQTNIRITEPLITITMGHVSIMLPQSYSEGSHRFQIKAQVESCHGTLTNSTVNTKVMCVDGVPLGVFGSCEKYIDLQDNSTYEVMYNGNKYTMNSFSLADIPSTMGDVEDAEIGAEMTAMMNALGIKINFLGIDAIFPLLEMFANNALENPQSVVQFFLQELSQPFILMSISIPNALERSFLIDLTTAFTMEYGLKQNGAEIIPFKAHAGKVIPLEGAGLVFSHKASIIPGIEYTLFHNGKTYITEPEVEYDYDNNIAGYSMVFGEEISDSHTIVHPGGYEIEEEISYSTEEENGIVYEVTTTYNGLKTIIERRAFIPVLSFYQDLSIPNTLFAYPNNYDVSGLENTVIPFKLKIDGAVSVYHKINKKYLPSSPSLLTLLLGGLGGLGFSGYSLRGRAETGNQTFLENLISSPAGQLMNYIPSTVLNNPIVKAIGKL